jgi:ATP-dependent Clp endopeptidase proteolytic subunit ClpP
MPLPNKKWYTMKADKGEAEITIYNDIGFYGITAEMFKKELDSLGELRGITIRINSYGGEVFDGNAIYNLIREKSPKVSITTIIDGIAASMASVLAMAGDKGKVKMRENAWIMIHDPTVMLIGSAKDLRKEADLLDGLKENIIKAYQYHVTSLSKDELWNLMQETTWLNATDAKEYGFVDEVI